MEQGLGITARGQAEGGGLGAEMSAPSYGSPPASVVQEISKYMVA